MITAKIEIVDKTMAKQLLQNNVGNRKIDMKTVHAYAEQMKAGAWEENGEGIIISRNGKLKNGQHRLMAIIETGIPIPLLIVRGVEDDVYLYDDNKRRSIKDQANMAGVEYNTKTGGIITLLLTGVTKQRRCGKKEALMYYAEHDSELNDAVSLSRAGVSGYQPLGNAVCATVIYCALRLGIMPRDELKAFCVIANSGLPNEAYVSNAPLVLRNIIVENKYSWSGSVMRRDLFEMTWNALEAFKAGKKSKQRFKPDGRAGLIINSVLYMDKEGK